MAAYRDSKESSAGVGAKVAEGGEEVWEQMQ